MTNKEAQIALANLKRYMSGGGTVDRGTNRAIDMAIEVLGKPEPHWIPVSERLPERDGEYLVSTLGIINGRTYTQVGEFSTATKSWIVYDSEYGYVPLYDVLAWMPLPKPYRGDSE